MGCAMRFGLRTASPRPHSARGIGCCLGTGICQHDVLPSSGEGLFCSQKVFLSFQVRHDHMSLLNFLECSRRNVSQSFTLNLASDFFFPASCIYTVLPFIQVMLEINSSLGILPGQSHIQDTLSRAGKMSQWRTSHASVRTGI